MNIHQGDFLISVGMREKDLPDLPEEIQREFDRLSDMSEPRDAITRRRCWELAGPFRRSLPCRRRF